MSKFPIMHSQSVYEFEGNVFVGFDEAGQAFTASHHKSEVERSIERYAKSLGPAVDTDEAFEFQKNDEPDIQVNMSWRQKAALEDLLNNLELEEGIPDELRPLLRDLESNNVIELDA